MSTQTCFITAGKTSQTFDVQLTQKAAATSPGDPLTGLAFNTSSFTAYYRKGATGTATAITLATQTVGGAWSSGGFVEISSANAPGLYRFDVPDTVIATAGIASVTFNGAANLETHTVYFIVTAVDFYDTVRMGLTALPNIAQGSSGALVTAGTGTAQLNVTGGRGDADVLRINTVALAAANLALSAGLIVPGTVTNAGLTPSTTQVECSDITTATTDFYVGRRILGQTGNRTFEAAQITAYSLVSGRGRFTFTTMTGAFANGDKLIIV